MPAINRHIIPDGPAYHVLIAADRLNQAMLSVGLKFASDALKQELPNHDYVSQETLKRFELDSTTKPSPTAPKLENTLDSKTMLHLVLWMPEMSMPAREIVAGMVANAVDAYCSN